MHNLDYYTYCLLEDKTLKVVLRGIPQSGEIEDIRVDFSEKGFDIIKVYH